MPFGVAVDVLQNILRQRDVHANRFGGALRVATKIATPSRFSASAITSSRDDGSGNSFAVVRQTLQMKGKGFFGKGALHRGAAGRNASRKIGNETP